MARSSNWDKLLATIPDKTTWGSFPHHVHFPTQQNSFQNDAFAERKPLPPIQCSFQSTNAQGSAFLLNIQQHCFQGKGEREEPVQLRCLEKCFPSIQFLNSFVQDCRSQPAWSCQFFKDPSRWSTPVRIYHNSIKILWLRVLVETKK